MPHENPYERAGRQAKALAILSHLSDDVRGDAGADALAKLDDAGWADLEKNAGVKHACSKWTRALIVETVRRRGKLTPPLPCDECDAEAGCECSPECPTRREADVYARKEWHDQEEI